MNPPQPAHPILIAGAGLSGLLLAQGLTSHSIPFRIFERDPAPRHRPQGYRIRIHGGPGIAALRSTLPPRVFALFQQTCADVQVGAGGRVEPLGGTWDDEVFGPWKTGLRERVERGEEEEPYTPDRAVLREVLMTGIEEAVEYGRAVQGYEDCAEGVVVRFTDGSSAVGRLLVGADGVGSRIRKQLVPGYRPVDTGGRTIYGKTPLTGELQRRMDERLLKGMVLAKDTSRAHPVTILYETLRFPQRDAVDDLPEDYVYWVMIMRAETVAQHDDRFWKMSSEESADLSLELTAKWAPSLRALLELQDRTRTSSLPVASMRPDIPAWEPSGKVTLLGDAAHVMSPCAAIGAVTAFRDAANLTRILVEQGVSKEAVGEYESDMRAYAKEAIENSFQGGAQMFGQRPFEECKVLDL